jgi:hypothetical protein
MSSGQPGNLSADSLLGKYIPDPSLLGSSSSGQGSSTAPNNFPMAKTVSMSDIIVPLPVETPVLQYNIKKQAPNMLNNFIRTSPEIDLYRLLKKEAKEIYNYASNSKNIADDEMIKLFKYYVYFKILSKIVKSNGTKTIDEIVKENVKKNKFSVMKNTTIRDKYAEKFKNLKGSGSNDYDTNFDDIVNEMNQKQSTIGTCINNISFY